jgi:hypothetical protein
LPVTPWWFLEGDQQPHVQGVGHPVKGFQARGNAAGLQAGDGRLGGAYPPGQLRLADALRFPQRSDLLA